MKQKLIILIALILFSGKVFSQIFVHDPVITQHNDNYYLFSTGLGITIWSSPDMKNWTRDGRVFQETPQWVTETLDDFAGHMWAPDIIFHNNQYYLYYSVSAFGKNTSCIGVATNRTLDPEDPDYKWVDHGNVVQSVPGRDDWNAIDPAIAFDDDGQPWMSFGSFWGGLKLVKLNDDLKTIAQPEEWHTIAKRPRSIEIDESEAGDGAIEAPFIFKKNGYYYLFVSFDYCCRGAESTYKIMVGRAKNIEGPYIDKEGKSMLEGGGSLVLKGNDDWYAIGHNAAYTFDGKDYLVCHGYDRHDNARQKLIIKEISWDKNDWPVVDQTK
ncbi:arabinan endo-1,5-alpha-L-arabinosidase [Draconibacterium sediminis]|uniref:ABC transporter substrate-binding protein n=1 Tax=Draconibacterium sediminis TaxID=1544798 RepID=A0A0D8J6I2_9BACT|nr:arabinan endo-1,5-alpha-L-arabinosidase [Draconibacterium sediminis]KJF42131.1 ABC transporter substrate-binding protein [Draconibacterium sediminis]